MFTVYVLQSDTVSYVGQTSNLLRRYRQHRRHECITTSKLSNIKLAHWYTVPSRYAALKLEVFLQRIHRLGGDYALYQLVNDVPVYCDLLRKAAWNTPDTAFQLLHADGTAKWKFQRSSK